jgi:hypothetical protein
MLRFESVFGAHTIPILAPQKSVVFILPFSSVSAKITGNAEGPGVN